MNTHRIKTDMLTKWRVGCFTLVRYHRPQTGRRFGTYAINSTGRSVVDPRWPGFLAAFAGQWEFRVHQS